MEISSLIFLETQVELLEPFKMEITSKCAQKVNHQCEFESKSSQIRGYYHLTEFSFILNGRLICRTPYQAAII